MAAAPAAASGAAAAESAVASAVLSGRRGRRSAAAAVAAVVATEVTVPRHGPFSAAWRRRKPRGAAGRVCLAVGCATLAVLVPGWLGRARPQRLAPARPPSDGVWGKGLPPASLAFLSFDEKDGRFCGREGDLCRCFGRVRYGRLFTWSDDLVVDGSVNCSAANFGDAVPMSLKICKCFPTICTTDAGTCTPEPCSCPVSREPRYEWGKKTLMTSDGVKCWACEKRQSAPGVLVEDESPYCPTQVGRCSLKRSCKCESPGDTKRVMRTASDQRCWTCAPPVGEGGSGAFSLDSGQKAMFWMLPILWPFMDFPASAWEVCSGCRALTTFCALCILGYILQTFAPFLRLDQFFSFYAPCMKKGELWRLFTYFMLHSDLQHLCVNLFHLLDALDLEGVPHLEISPGVPLRCTRDGSADAICYPDVGIGRNHIVAIFAVVLAYGALLGTIRNFGALVQGASSVCFGVDGALIAIYGMFLGAGLDEQLKIPEFGAFFWMRIGIIAFHIIIDVLQSVCGGGKDTIGTMAHLASLVAGFCYVIVMLPPMGDGSLFDSRQPYIIDCGLTSPSYVSLDGATSQCLAFFNRANGIQVSTARTLGLAVLAGGVLVSAANAVHKRDISDDGIACCSDGGANVNAAHRDSASRTASSHEDEHSRAIAALQKHCEVLGEGIEQLERLYGNMPNPETLAQHQALPDSPTRTAA
eukprot:TRINITY_DN23490_c0_g1_i1.p1 TRINITY_DN23490_c0_g1~~TRINITY_DN23490_c0_g1_i1.p1  ORF type:complete len:713 (-),score=90.49 TRINITY_DN23490_c0_g1_i1:65-2158(-)